jgi:hypothetical protein
MTTWTKYVQTEQRSWRGQRATKRPPAAIAAPFATKNPVTPYTDHVDRSNETLYGKPMT